MALPAVQTRLEQLDSFVIEPVMDVCSTRLNWQVDDGTAIGDGQTGPFGSHQFNGCIGFGGKMTGRIAPVTASNLYRLPELPEEPGVRVFAKLDAGSNQ